MGAILEAQFRSIAGSPEDGPTFREATAPEFVQAITIARRRRRVDPEGRTRSYGETVHQYTEDEYGWMRLYLTQAGGTGFALKRQPNGDLDLVSVFSSGGPTTGVDAIRAAVDLGADTVDVFDEHGFLPWLYRTCGFLEVDREPWNPDYAPEGWNGDTPDVVYMRYPR